jgi:hypothetical protein
LRNPLQACPLVCGFFHGDITVFRVTYERLNSSGAVTQSTMRSSLEDFTEPFVDVAESKCIIEEVAYDLILRSCWNMVDSCEAKEKFAEIKKGFAVRRKMLDTLMSVCPDKTKRLDAVFEAMCSGEYWNNPEKD